VGIERPPKLIDPQIEFETSTHGDIIRKTLFSLSYEYFCEMRGKEIGKRQNVVCCPHCGGLYCELFF
jgi:hypothetical protein